MIYRFSHASRITEYNQTNKDQKATTKSSPLCQQLRFLNLQLAVLLFQKSQKAAVDVAGVLQLFEDLLLHDHRRVERVRLLEAVPKQNSTSGVLGLEIGLVRLELYSCERSPWWTRFCSCC